MLLLGAGRHAKEVIDILLNLGWNTGDLLCFADYTTHSTVCGIRTTTSEVDALLHSQFTLASGSSSLRELFYYRALDWGLVPSSLIASTARVSSLATLAFGLNIMEYVYVGPNSLIGTGTLLNTNCSIHHDVSVGTFCEIAPGARVLGGVSIGSNSMIGANAVILPDVRIGEGCIIGAGAVVIRDLEPNSKVVGIPARPIQE